MKIIGVAGKAGCGKSLLVSLLSGPDTKVIDLDKLGHEVLEELKGQLLLTYGSGILDDSKKKIDRKKLGEIVFKDPKKLRLLNSIMHPLIKEKVKKIISRTRKKYVLIDGALIHQIGLGELCDLIIWVDCPNEIAIKRLISRGIPHERAVSILSIQKELENYKAYSDIAIDNTGSPQELLIKVREILREKEIML